MDLTTIYAIAASTATMVATLVGVVYWLGGKFKEIDIRFSMVDGRFGIIDERFRQIDEGFKQMDERMTLLERRMSNLENRIGNLESRMDNLENRMNNLESRMNNLENRMSSLEGRIVRLEERFSRFTDLVGGALISINSLMIEYLGAKNVLTKDEVEVLVHEINRWASTIKVNPISKEEVEYIKSVTSKKLDEITLEEIDKVVEIAKRWWYEGGGEVAYRIFLYAYIVRTYKYFEKIRREREGDKG
jgi:chromosome segregation ATPase